IRQPWGSALLKRAELLFGSWSAALIAASVDLPAGTFSPWPKANKPDILKQIRRRKRKGKTLHFKSIEKERWGKPLLQKRCLDRGIWPLQRPPNSRSHDAVIRVYDEPGNPTLASVCAQQISCIELPYEQIAEPDQCCSHFFSSTV